MRCDNMPFGMAKMTNSDNTQCKAGREATGMLTNCWVECKLTRPLVNMVWHFLIKNETYTYLETQQSSS